MMDVSRAFAIVVATFFGAGKFRYASGTVGSLAALPVIWLIQSTLGNSAVVVFAVLLFFLGVWASRVYIEISGDKDPKPVVVDEVVGQAIAISFLPVSAEAYIAAFILFRFFDVTKIWPANWAERRPNQALAVMLDDVIAGFYAGVVSVLILELLI